MPTPRKLTYDDLWSFKNMGNIALSPDGKSVAFAMQSLDEKEDERRSAIWLLRLDKQGHAVGEPRQLTSGSKNDTNPVWAPDSQRLLFLSNREGENNQLWLIDTGGGEARRLTNMLRGVSEVAWSPNGQWIAFTAMAMPMDDDDVLTGRKTLNADEKKQREEEERYDMHTITKIWYRLDGRGLFDKFSQLFVMPAPGTDIDFEEPASSAVHRLTSGDFDHILPSWTPDSNEIGVLCNRAEDRDGSFVSDLWVIARETEDARCLTAGNLQIECYSWSPDGQSALLVAEQDMRIEGVSNSHLYLVSREGGAIEDVTPNIDNSTSPPAVANFGRPGPYIPQWSKDGQHVYFPVSEQGYTNVYRLDVAERVSTALTSNENLIYFLALLPNEQGLILAQSQPLHPWELYLLPLKGDGVDEMVRLTHLYDHQLSGFAWSEPQKISYQGANGDEIEGWMVLPVGARQGVRYPLIVNIHGGPHSLFTVGMSLYFQYLAAQGFAIFYCNPHGSSGYGQSFMREVMGDWGGWDYQDIMCGVDECIARGVADPERMVVTGYSYGGYMSMFIIGQTDRFKAAVPMAGVSNLSSFVGTSDIGFWQVAEAKGYPWEPEREAYYRERSPLTYAGKVTTPTRLIHPEDDLRCPIEQSEQFYMVLKMMGKVPVELVRMPEAWHVNTNKQSKFFGRWEKMMEWFKKWVEIRMGEYEEQVDAKA